jgi:hypothetical protein
MDILVYEIATKAAAIKFGNTDEKKTDLRPTMMLVGFLKVYVVAEGVSDIDFEVSKKHFLDKFWKNAKTEKYYAESMEFTRAVEKLSEGVEV